MNTNALKALIARRYNEKSLNEVGTRGIQDITIDGYYVPTSTAGQTKLDMLRKALQNRCINIDEYLNEMNDVQLIAILMSQCNQEYR